MLFNKRCYGAMPQFGCAPMMPQENCCDGGNFAQGSMPQSDRCCQNMNQTREQCIVEPTINKCIEKEFYHEVPHVCPIHTHVINRHIYNHSYTPQYTCSEENQVCNIDNGPCCKFV